MKAFRSRRKVVQSSQNDNQNDRWIRKFAIEVAGRSNSGKGVKISYTLYKITSYIYPKEFPEAITALTVLKRYNELRQLQKTLLKIHEQLNLPGKMPNYTRHGYFKRFDVEVIEDRRKTTETLLEFVALYPALFTSTEFVRFFESSHLDAKLDDSGSNIESIRNTLLLPIEVIRPIEYQSSEEESLSLSDPLSNSKQKESFGNKNSPNANLPDILDHTHLKIESKPDSPTLPESVILHCAPNSPMSSKYVSLDKSVADVTDGIRSRLESFYSHKSETDADSMTNSNTDDTLRSDNMSISQMSDSTTALQNSYIFEAGYILHLGTQNEAEGNYQMAFNCYKAGIEKLLIGVQGETSELWRNLVRDKTNKYLAYAQNIYTNYLQDSKSTSATDSEIFRKKIITDSKNLSLCHPYEYLNKYKFHKLLDEETMLVSCNESKTLYAMKAIRKTCIMNESTIQNDLPILPYGVPYMVKLISYIETRNLLFLILQYIPGGSFFDHLVNHRADFKQDETHTSANESEQSNQLVNDAIDEILTKSHELLLKVDKTLHGITDKTEKSPIKTDAGSESADLEPDQSKNDFVAKRLPRYGAELLIAIDHLHQRGVICRNLNPANLLLGDHENVILTYILGTNLQESLIDIHNDASLDLLYVAPELLDTPLEITDETVCDFWSYGALMYKLLLGESLSSVHPTGFNSHTTLIFPYPVPENVKSLLSNLLCYDPGSRLGSGPTGIDEIKNHPYFSDIDWNIVETEYDLNLI